MAVANGAGTNVWLFEDVDGDGWVDSGSLVDFALLADLLAGMPVLDMSEEEVSTSGFVAADLDLTPLFPEARGEADGFVMIVETPEDAGVPSIFSDPPPTGQSDAPADTPADTASDAGEGGPPELPSLPPLDPAALEHVRDEIASIMDDLPSGFSIAVSFSDSTHPMVAYIDANGFSG